MTNALMLLHTSSSAFTSIATCTHSCCQGSTLYVFTKVGNVLGVVQRTQKECITVSFSTKTLALEPLVTYIYVTTIGEESIQ